MLRYFALLGCVFSSGCSLLPEIAHQPTLHNPFPQLAKVAVTPFTNASQEPTLNGDQVALAYFAELQAVPGFEVVPLGVVRAEMQAGNIELDSPADVRRLAQRLGVDVVVVGVVTDYTPYYPPRCGLKVEWYAANPNFHPIPPGYGLPWGTVDEEGIPGPLVFEAEFALAKEQLKTQTPPFDPEAAAEKNQPTTLPAPPGQRADPIPDWPGPKWGEDGQVGEGVEQLSYESPAGGTVAGAPSGPQVPEMPPNWPDPRGFIPPPPSREPMAGWPSDAPVMWHTAIYDGSDAEFTEALASYHFFRDDARFGGWQGILQRSDDFLRFCCRLHISAMLSARGGAGQTRVVWRWPSIR